MAESSIVLASEKITRESDELKIIRAAKQDPKAFGDLYKLYVEQSSGISTAGLEMCMRQKTSLLKHFWLPLNHLTGLAGETLCFLVVYDCPQQIDGSLSSTEKHIVN